MKQCYTINFKLQAPKDEERVNDGILYILPFLDPLSLKTIVQRSSVTIGPETMLPRILIAETTIPLDVSIHFKSLPSTITV